MIQLLYWLAILSTDISVGAKIVYGAWSFFWWLGDKTNNTPIAGVPLNFNGNTIYVQIGDGKV